MLNTIRIVIADDTDIAREGLKRILAAESEMDIVDECASLHETVRKVQELQPDILILDLKWFSDESAGIEAIKRLRVEVPKTRVIAITIYPHLVAQARSAGAIAAMNKEVPKAQLIEEIRSVYALLRPASSIPSAVTLPPTPFEQLSTRESEVLALMAEGRTDREIADVLSVAESTAKNHVNSILGKLNAPNRASAVANGYQLGLIRPELNKL